MATTLVCERCGQMIYLHEPTHVERTQGLAVRFLTTGHDGSAPGHSHSPAGWGPLLRRNAK